MFHNFGTTNWNDNHIFLPVSYYPDFLPCITPALHCTRLDCRSFLLLVRLSLSACLLTDMTTVSFPDGNKDGVELKPMTNGHHKTSRSGSVISILSNGTNVSNGVLKNKSVSMSPENLKQIESAFHADRVEYASFQASMDASAPKLPPAVIVSEDTNSEKKTTIFAPSDPKSESSRQHNISLNLWPNRNLSFSYFLQISKLVCKLLKFKFQLISIFQSVIFFRARG